MGAVLVLVRLSLPGCAAAAQLSAVSLPGTAGLQVVSRWRSGATRLCLPLYWTCWCGAACMRGRQRGMIDKMPLWLDGWQSVESRHAAYLPVREMIVETHTDQNTDSQVKCKTSGLSRQYCMHH
jgi:hypothetical protein